MSNPLLKSSFKEQSSFSLQNDPSQFLGSHTSPSTTKSSVFNKESINLSQLKGTHRSQNLRTTQTSHSPSIMPFGTHSATLTDKFMMEEQKTIGGLNNTTDHSYPQYNQFNRQFREEATQPSDNLPKGSFPTPTSFEEKMDSYLKRFRDKMLADINTYFCHSFEKLALKFRETALCHQSAWVAEVETSASFQQFPVQQTTKHHQETSLQCEQTDIVMSQLHMKEFEDYDTTDLCNNPTIRTSTSEKSSFGLRTERKGYEKHSKKEDTLVEESKDTSMMIKEPSLDLQDEAPVQSEYTLTCDNKQGSNNSIWPTIMPGEDFGAKQAVEQDSIARTAYFLHKAMAMQPCDLNSTNQELTTLNCPGPYQDEENVGTKRMDLQGDCTGYREAQISNQRIFFDEEKRFITIIEEKRSTRQETTFEQFGQESNEKDSTFDKREDSSTDNAIDKKIRLSENKDGANEVRINLSLKDSQRNVSETIDQFELRKKVPQTEGRTVPSSLLRQIVSSAKRVMNSKNGKIKSYYDYIRVILDKLAPNLDLDKVEPDSDWGKFKRFLECKIGKSGKFSYTSLVDLVKESPDPGLIGRVLEELMDGFLSSDGQNHFKFYVTHNKLNPENLEIIKNEEKVEYYKKAFKRNCWDLFRPKKESDG